MRVSKAKAAENRAIIVKTAARLMRERFGHIIAFVLHPSVPPIAARYFGACASLRLPALFHGEASLCRRDKSSPG